MKGKLMYSLITKQDGQIILPETAKNRSASSIIKAINYDGSELHVGDIILHGTKYNKREADSAKSSFVGDDGQLNKLMDVDDVYAKVVNGHVIPIGDWLFCKMIIPESSIAGIYDNRDCRSVQIAACGLDADKGLPIRVGASYLISGWSEEMRQMAFGNDVYIFMKVSSLVAEIKDDQPVAMMN